MQRLTKLYGRNAYGLVNVRDDEQEVDSPHPNTLKAILQSFARLGEYEDILYADGTPRITLDRLRELVQADSEGRAVVLPCKVEPFDCQHCKHLSPSDKTNRLFCSYHGEGEHQYEVYLDDYCSYFERAEAEAKGEQE